MEKVSLDRRWQRLVDLLVAAGTLRTPRIVEAFRATSRAAFVPPSLAESAVTADAPLPIGDGQTVSQPTTVATMLELVQPRSGERVLDVGTGSGWQAALLARCVGSRGMVVTIERIPELARAAAAALDRVGALNVVRFVGDATALAAGHGPYDVIVSAAASREIPSAWIAALKPGGRLLHPIAGMGLKLLRKAQDGTLSSEDYPGYVFVPLVSE